MASSLPSLLLASLSPVTRKQSEAALGNLATQPGFSTHLLRLVLTPTEDRSVRLAGAIYLKNIAKLQWVEEINPVSESDKADLRKGLVPAMLALSSPQDKTMRAQIAETVQLIAELDFPDRWGNLIDQLVSSLSQTDYNINIAVLETAHSIFQPWRAHVRSDALFTEINLVFTSFMNPFLAILRHTTSILLSGGSGKAETQAMVLLMDIFHDFVCQDLPPAIEDTHDEFFAPETGMFLRYLEWDPLELRTDQDDITPSLPAQLKTRILEIAELYIKLYPDKLLNSPSVAAFVRSVWNLVGAGKLPGVGDDQLVAQALRYISTAIRTGYYKDLFSSKSTIESLIQGVVVPNVGLRESDIELFEDDPLEYIRLSLPSSAGSSDHSTRRQAAADVLQALVASGPESEADTTEIVGRWIGQGLAAYAADKNEWRMKDSSVYLMGAVATRGSTAQSGVTSTNVLVDVVSFFSQNVFEDLQAAEGTVHPILQVDSIRFLYTFRNQLTKAQLLTVLPLLVGHLRSTNYVCYTYAAITIDRILFIKQGNALLFSQADIHDSAAQLLDAVLSKIESSSTPEKVAENDHLMKCAMRVIVTAKQTLVPGFERTLTRLVGILGIVSKNPSNPNFDQYMFESISALVRFVVAGSPPTLASFEQALFGPFTFILQQDIEQYIPFVFQILAQMLSLHTTAVPVEYRSLLPFLLTPAGWQQKGSVPGLVRLLRAFLEKDSSEMVRSGQLAAVLAVVQQRLIPSKINDGWGIELLQSVVQFVSPNDLSQYFQALVVTLLTRMQTSKKDKYVYIFTYFFLFSMSITTTGISPDYIIGAVEQTQAGLWSNILSAFIIPQIPKMIHKDRKVAVIGLARMLTQSTAMLQPPAVQQWPIAFTALAKLFDEPQYLTKDSTTTDTDVGITAIDHEEQNVGYQAAYSRLAASEVPGLDPVAEIRDPRDFVGKELTRLVASDARVKTLLNQTAPGVTAAFLQSLDPSGLALGAFA